MEIVVKKYLLNSAKLLLMSNVKITIPKPCSEDWGNMKQLEQSKFCTLCEKEVFDFTKFSIPELQDYFKSPKVNVCGRMSEKQLNDFVSTPNEANKFKHLSFKLFVASCIAFLANTKSYSKENIQILNTYQSDVKVSQLPDVIEEADTLITVTGIVIDSNDGLPIPGVSISLKDGPSITTTGVDGKFKIQIKSRSNQELILVSKYLGYDTSETVISSTNDQKLQIRLTQSAGLLGEVVIAGGIVIKRPLLNRIGYFFKRIFTGR